MQTDFASSSVLSTLFEAQADRTPERIAVTCGGRALSYAALDSHAERLAGHLRGLGVGPEVRVAVCLERGLDLVVALLAVLKAGGAYVPLDPEHPTTRIEYYLMDAAPAVLITRGEGSLVTPGGTRRVDLDADAATIAACPATRRPATASPANLAYVLYTSGSTGTPKGVEVTNGNVARLFTATAPSFAFGPADVWSLCHAPTFDFSVWELFGALLHGGRVVVVPRAVTREPDELARLLVAEGVTMLSQTPSAFRQLMPVLLAGPPSPLRWIVFGGEALDPAMLRPWIERHGDDGPRLVNMYGITETTVHVTSRRITARDLAASTGSVIGRPLPDLEIALLDARGRPVAAGEVGEIHVAGAGVARGYLGRPTLTAERFVTLADGRRAYRSGDLARALPDGELVYLGRTDAQVKIRGHRVEPGEVQALLLAEPDVADAAVVARTAGDDTALVAYVVPAHGRTIAGPRLRAALASRLPAYMVPAAIVTLDRLPLTVHGKLDVAALPAAARPEPRAPGSTLEATLCECLARALGCVQVGLDDNFVALGGQSLGAAQAARELTTALGRPISVAALLGDRTVAELAVTLATAEPRTSTPTARVDRASAVELGMWLHARRYPGDCAYNEALSLQIRGRVDEQTLAACLAELAARHPALRTGFVWRDGELAREVAAQVVVPLVTHDLRRLALEDAAAAAQRLAETAARQPFDLATPPLLRATLVHLDARAHRIELVLHHAICDAHSLHTLARELAELHDARANGGALHLPPLPVVDHGAPEAAPFAGRPAHPRLFVDHPGSPDDRAAAREALRLSPALVGSLRTLAARERATLFAVLLAGWHALLYRHGSGEATRVGVVTAVRSREDQLAAIGPLFTTTSIAARPRGDVPFASLIVEVRAALLAALDGPADLGDEGFETGLGLLPGPPRLVDGWQVRPLAVGNGAAKHDLLVLLHEDADGGLSGCIEYRTALRRSTTIERLAGHFVALLTSAAAEPQRPLAALELLTAGERSALAAWRRGPTCDDTDTVTARFLDRALRAPDATAVAWPGGSLSYALLAARAGALAGRLVALGVGSDRLVAIGLERSPALVSALLAVHLAGAAALLLDPRQPDARLAQLLADAGPAYVLTTEALRADFAGVPCVLVDDAASVDPPPDRSRPDQLAYVVYTSGSSGRPKGVMVEHHSLSSLATAFRDQLSVGPGSRVLQAAPVTFDVALMEILCTLAAGATVVLASAAAPLIGDELLRVLRDQAITCAALPASLLLSLPTAELPALATLISGGEVCPAEVVERWAPGRRFINAYGPTEATIGATLADCRPGEGKPPIGRPRAGVEVLALDAYRQAVPVGVPGELWLGGPCLARGYLNQPEATAASFVVHGADRLYRTGDRVRWRDDGQLEFIGRVDRQLKLRGIRIEPAEIEAALRQVSSVRDAVVVAREVVPGHPTLCAYVVTEADAPDDSTLRASLRARLPESMVPATIVRMAGLPLTAHGKIDLASLPAPPRGEVAPEDVDATSVEARIAAVWREVLAVAHVGHDDSFFDLGGTSLLLARVQPRLAAVLGRPIPLPMLFERNTPRALARLLREPELDVAGDAATRAERQRRARATRRPIKGGDHG